MKLNIKYAVYLSFTHLNVMLFEFQFFPMNLFITLVTYKCLKLKKQDSTSRFRLDKKKANEPQM